MVPTTGMFNEETSIDRVDCTYFLSAGPGRGQLEGTCRESGHSLRLSSNYRQSSLTFPGPVYRVLAQVKSLMCISWGLIRTIGPDSRLSGESKSRARQRTIFLVQALQLMHELPAGLDKQIKVCFIPPRCGGKSGTGEFGQRVEE